MPIADFFQGLLGGLAGGVVEQAQTERKMSFLKEMENARIAGDLIRSGNYEALALVDPKILKGLGFEQQDPRLEALIGFQRKQRQTKERQQELELGAAQTGLETAQFKLERAKQMAPLEQKGAELGLDETQAKTAEAQRVARSRQALTPEEQKIQDNPVLAQFHAAMEGREQRRQQHEDSMANAKERLALLQEQLEAAKGNREAQNQIRQDIAGQKREATFNAQMITVDKQIDSVLARARDKKTGTPVELTKAQSDAVVAELNRLVNEKNSLIKQYNSTAEVKKAEEPLYESGLTSSPLIGANKYLPIQKTSGVETSTAPSQETSLSGKLESRLASISPGSKPQGSAEALPSATPSVSSGAQTLQIPNDQKTRVRWIASIQRARRLVGGNKMLGTKDDAVEGMTKAGIPKDVAQRAVDENSLDMLMQSIIAAGDMETKR